MNMKEVKELLQEILQSDILEFELEHTGTKMRLRRGLSSEAQGIHDAPPPQAATELSRRARIEVKAAAPPPPEAEEADLHYITSPIVGTFYRSPSPGAENFVKVGDIVEDGKTLCIVEAMKLMNEIPSDVTGEIVRICVENGHPVEFGQQLFAIRLMR